MKKRLFSILAALLLVAVAVPAAWAALAPAPGGVGIPIDPHGFPAFYADATGLSLEPCLPPPAGNATKPGMCLPSPIVAGNPESAALGVGDEFFFWSADAEAPPLVAGGNARLVLALEGAFGTATGEPADGQQMTFGRVRIRVDTPVAGTYTVTHPFGTQTFEVTDVAAGINFTEDIGSINPADPKAAFAGALGSKLGPFLTWPGFDTDPTLQALDPVSGAVLEQYIGNPGVPHVVTPGPNGSIFRVVGPGGITTQTNLFAVAGKVFDSTVARTEHLFPAAPAANLFAVGPVNRVASINAVAPPVGTVTGADVANYPVGFPLWYQDNAGTPAAPAPGIQLTICPAADPMCISAPVDPADPASVALRTGEEGFFWSAEADAIGQGVNGLLVLALEAAFGGAGTPADGQQIVFGRLRIRIDTPVAGTYTVTHPYGTETFINVPAERRAINFTRDIGIIDPVNPDTAFVGALTSDIGPRFLTWPDFTNPLVSGNAVLQKPDPSNPPSGIIQYVGNPLTPHVVTGGSNGNVFRIVGPGIDVQTNLFTVSGKVFGAGNVAPPPIPVGAVAVADAVETIVGVPVTIPVLANDTINDTAVAPAAVTVTRLPASGPLNGTALVNANNTVTYTPAAGFVGTDTFTYQFAETAVGGATSNNATVTITVTPPLDIIVLKKARVDLAKLAIEVEGTDNVPGSILTIRAGATATSPVIGTVLVPADGVWRFRGRITSNLTSISITSSNGGMLLNRLIQVR